MVTSLTLREQRVLNEAPDRANTPRVRRLLLQLEAKLEKLSREAGDTVLSLEVRLHNGVPRKAIWRMGNEDDLQTD